VCHIVTLVSCVILNIVALPSLVLLFLIFLDPRGPCLCFFARRGRTLHTFSLFATDISPLASLQSSGVCRTACEIFDAISKTCSRSERCNTKFFVGATSAIGTNRKLDGELLRNIVRRILGDMCKHEGNEYDGEHVQHHR
jgi:hypothetical protein